MGLGLRKRVSEVYIALTKIRFKMRNFFLGFDNANKLFLTMDKRAAIPILRKYGAQIGNNCDIETPLIFHNCNNFKNLMIGNNCHIGKNCFFDLRNRVEIGDNTTISMQTTFITHIDVGRSNLKKFFPPTDRGIVIHDNVYIGAKSTILMGVELESNSFIAAGSLVVKDVDSHVMVGGIPAKVIKKL